MLTEVAGCTTTITTTITTTVSNETGVDFGNFENILISGKKFYDGNANGVDDDGMVVGGLTIQLTVESGAFAGAHYTTTDPTGMFYFGDLDNADGDNNYATGSDLGPSISYTVVEVMGSLTGNWVQTYGTSGYVIFAGGDVLSGGTSAGNSFGNVQLGNGGGHTLGFWSKQEWPSADQRWWHQPSRMGDAE